MTLLYLRAHLTDHCPERKAHAAQHCQAVLQRAVDRNGTPSE